MNDFIFMAIPERSHGYDADLNVNGKKAFERDPHPCHRQAFPQLQIGEEIELIDFNLDRYNKETYRNEYTERFRFKGKIVAKDESRGDYIPTGLNGRYQRILVRGEVLNGPTPGLLEPLPTSVGTFQAVFRSGVA